MSNGENKEETKGLNIKAKTKETLYSERRFRQKFIWNCGKLQIDQRILYFISKWFFSIVLLIFCCYEISIDSDACTNPLLNWYTTIIGIIVTTWIGHLKVNSSISTISSNNSINNNNNK